MEIDWLTSFSSTSRSLGLFYCQMINQMQRMQSQHQQSQVTKVDSLEYQLKHSTATSARRCVMIVVHHVNIVVVERTITFMYHGRNVVQN